MYAFVEFRFALLNLQCFEKFNHIVAVLVGLHLREGGHFNAHGIAIHKLFSSGINLGECFWPLDPLIQPSWRVAFGHIFEAWRADRAFFIR